MQDKLVQLNVLTTQFRDNIKQYKSTLYDEANTRVDFIDKMFELFDWDVRNNQGYSELYRDVVREDKVQIEGKQKAPDYSFRIGGVRKFFVEAKKPSVLIKDDMMPAFQVRRYGYTAKLPLSILTDFEEFAIYDTRIKPDKNDKASVARIFYCTYDEYEKNFEFIYNTFSKNAILKGSFDKYIEENKNKKGTGEVDKELLKVVEEWRTELAKNIALRNNDIDIYNLNNAVQKIIDRIIFLRIAEDKEIESYEQLLVLTKSAEIYVNLNEIFTRANKKYNSGLFQPESWLTGIKIDDKILSTIIKGLYYPECPYEFSILPIEILGNIYEQFLGKTIRFKNVKDGQHTAVIEEKPEVRKAGGVYYTPSYIVNYIVENTIGEKIKGKSPDEIAGLTICDPACGSGSFLVGAYQYLLNYHQEYYTGEKNCKKALKDEKIFQLSENSFKLTIEEKQKILTNSIYGVDIDPQAVEVTKLSLYLKLLENEGKEAEGSLFKHSDLKLLPTLDKNIKCGNSLIGSDFYKDKDLSLFGNDEMRKVNVFDWEVEFPGVFRGDRNFTTEGTEVLEGSGSRGGAGGAEFGFDVVIGNPPYGAELSEQERIYLDNKFSLRNTDTACLFIGLSLNILNLHGSNGFIIPKPFVYASNWKVIREKLLEIITEIVDCGKVWKEVKLEQVIYFFNKEKSTEFYYSSVRDNNQIIRFGNINKLTFNQFGFYLNGISEKELSIGEKMLTIGHFLNEFVKNQRGAIYQEFVKDEIDDLMVLGGKQINRYFLNDHVKGYISRKHIQDEKAYIKDKSILVQRLVAHIINPKPHVKIIATIPNIQDKKFIIIDTINQLTNESELSSKFLLSLLNSKLISWYSYLFIFGKAIRTMQFDNPTSSKIPIPKIDLSISSEKAQHDKLVSLVDHMLDVQKSFHSAGSDSDKKMFKQKIDLIDGQIDSLVYGLYGLTEDEIRVVEGE
ncbi:MAG: hypothetical protein A2015_02370 [Spirochaetes bacterium GWF1_31_7]|nr:MAG: hypothetical protein A2Y30_06220 [Spirochaetes bacterium GWE1_32_154]OHD50774.1 MAG: hypothetical protein A2015_02370 [Spirochaetes bacterium GWF1_31_7]OHD51972.1 MAG: hypothetical protein A2Y29_07175 [Spirochaetes bacterium GWE2_31_10]HBD95097.1 restriction endonuclease subunit R [Spirochaetia bacterium]HBI38017.1 restriction endonuclease subunit R [Spirochaetia bacterium]